MKYILLLLLFTIDNAFSQQAQQAMFHAHNQTPCVISISSISGTSPVCLSQNGVAYSVTNIAGVSYTWTYSGTGFTKVSGGTTYSITANFSATATSGILSVTPS